MKFRFLDQIDEEEIQEQLSLIEQWLEDLCDWFLSNLPKFIAALVILLVGLWLSKFICKIVIKAMKKTNADPTVTEFLKSILNIVLKVLVVITAISTLGFDMTSIIASLAAAAVAIGLALQDSLSNVASGVLIILNKKFKVGDYLETEGLTGTVIRIEMMNTVLKTYDNKEIIIPNSNLMSNNITNHFAFDERRVDLNVGISYEDDIDKARAILWNIIRSKKEILQENQNQIIVNDLGESSVEISVKVWCKSDDYWNVLADMKESIKKSFDENGISIPYNQIDVHMQEEKKSE